ncbi:uncharacterized protein isoform X2 [Musca autumnalis]|uniref:uncharacterized protein isoform X2 n=1 Tax=Musca autumnalis TaxID=221902 RepID=UPI003CED54A4
MQNMEQINHNTMFNSTTPGIGQQQMSSLPRDVDLMVENVMPGIYLTKNFISWQNEQLRAHGFTHVIIIDKHIQELYYPHQQPEIFKLCANDTAGANKRSNTISGLHDDSSSLLSSFGDYDPNPRGGAAALNFGKEFDVIDLNFGEKSYLTTVLPNCYRAVKFINKALQSGGTILVIDCNGGEQKCLTIIVAYLMYKHNISFSNAFARLKEFYNKADLDRFYISQLYEYEPILQVQRAQSRGHSCSRELHAAILKRKKTNEDDAADVGGSENHSQAFSFSSTYTNAHTLLDNCNPLNRFDSTQMDINSSNTINSRSVGIKASTKTNSSSTTFTQFMGGTTRTGGWYNWDDYAME